MFIFYAVAFSFFDAAGTPVQGILRGYKDVKIITYVAFVTYWLISIPMAMPWPTPRLTAPMATGSASSSAWPSMPAPELAPVETYGLEVPISYPSTKE